MYNFGQTNLFIVFQLTEAKKMTAGSIASVVIAILVVIAIIVIAMFCLIDRRRPSTGRYALS